MDEIANGGRVVNWDATRDEIIQRLSEILEDFAPAEPFVDTLTGVKHTVDELRADIVSRLYTYSEPPFTIQRLAELIQTSQVYGKGDVYKYLHAVLKTLSVTSTVNDFDDDEMLSSLENPEENSVRLSEIDWMS